jgi:hypothetical protein
LPVTTAPMLSSSTAAAADCSSAGMTSSTVASLGPSSARTPRQTSTNVSLVRAMSSSSAGHVVFGFKAAAVEAYVQEMLDA